MAHLKTRRHPAAAAHGYEWADGDTVVEVADEHATELLRVQGAEFYEVLPSDPEHPDYQAWVEAQALAEAQADAEATDVEETTQSANDGDPDAGADVGAELTTEPVQVTPADAAAIMKAAAEGAKDAGTHRVRERARAGG